jgi:Ni,Fe-hydrogenase maturation factor
MARSMNALPERVLIVGCQPTQVDELEQGLSPAVEKAVAVAASRVEGVVREWLAEPVDAA